MQLKDVQSDKPSIEIDIDEVGVENVVMPIIVDDYGEPQHTVANFSLSIDLPRHSKGAHMSRFVEQLYRFRQEVFDIGTLMDMLANLASVMQSRHATIQLAFPLFRIVKAPATGRESMINYECMLRGTISKNGCSITKTVTVPVTSLCPCSKEISESSAHNQRGRITARVRLKKTKPGFITDIPFSILIQYAEESASSRLYPLLKREDEKHVTEAAYNNPKFVEDIVRGIASALYGEDRVASFKCTAVNYESIHNHDVFAVVHSRRRVG